jgi:hypothetical protein
VSRLPILTDEPNEIVASYHALDEFTVRPMDRQQHIIIEGSFIRAMNNVMQKDLAAIDPEAQAA